jgi:hypothetical protein
VSAPIYRKRTSGVTVAQAELLADEQGESATKSFHTICFVGGLGSGKTRGLSMKAILLARANAGTGVPVLFGMPTFPQLEGIVIPTVLALLDEWGFVEGESFTRERKRNRITIHFEEGDGILMFRPLADDRATIGYNLAAALVDEVEDVPPDSIKQIKARLRDPAAKLRQLVLGGTPESLGGQFFQEVEGNPDEDTHVIRAKTIENHFLPDGYVDMLLKSFDEHERALYTEGRFVPRRGRIYTHFTRDLVAVPCDDPWMGQQIMGADFGKGCMAWAFGRVHDDVLHIHHELVAEGKDTIECAREARAWWMRFFSERSGVSYDERKAASMVSIYCDPAGGADMKGSASDVRILREFGFAVYHQHKHPRVKDRINAVNLRLMAGALRIDPISAPYMLRCLEQHQYDKNGFPEKGRPRDGAKGLDHGADAIGYPVEYLWPAARGTATIVEYN